MLYFPNAKINIGLFITEKRTDGFHNLETIFYPVMDCKDALEIIHHDKDEFIILGNEIPGDSNNNLVLKALELIRNDYEISRQTVKIILYKKIPSGAGLGGGSADAGFALKLIDEFFSLNISEKDLLDYALRLGSDVPFFIHNRPMFATGRGEIFQPISLDLNKYEIKLIHHDFHIATAQAFAGIIPKKPKFDLSNINSCPIEEWKYYVENDFEKSIFKLYPDLAISKEKLYHEGAVYASMTGTGATVYGIFPKK